MAAAARSLRPPISSRKRSSSLASDALHGALIDAGERLAGACSERWDGDAGVESVRAEATEVIGLDRLLARIEDRGA